MALAYLLKKNMKRIVTIFLFLITSNFILCQKSDNRAEMKIIYEMKMGNISENKDTSIYYYDLIFDKNSSIYADSNAKAYYDYIAKERGNYRLLMRPPKGKGSAYKENGKLIVSQPIGRDMYSYDEPALKWVIINEKKKKIGDYDCILAKTSTDTGIIFYAWFTPKIPIPEGPFRFKGLAGVILEVYNEINTIHISAIEIRKSNAGIYPLQYPKVYHVSKKDFLDKRKTFIANPKVEAPLDFIIKETDSGFESKKTVHKSINPNYLLD
ncbi:GLPGLI family protein [Elizabethkingia anophelis]|uniref:GLPGLI family protein n=3 Tax=Elizabethkingia anophelis TaxID=1117645 RepID=A0A7Z7LU60_9FLAO|nr:GLPGLI family protein [Elizabethkingia anophelis]STC96051.1 GLPGLI family protein [Elizabethkingia anophelis]